MGLKKYFTFEGRISRGYYFGIPILLRLILLLFEILVDYSNNILIWILFFLICILASIVHICISVQRLHDIGRPGTHYWLSLIPIYNIYFALVLLFEKGTDGPNEYGEDPLAIIYE